MIKDLILWGLTVLNLYVLNNMLQKNKYSIIVFTRVKMGNTAFYFLEVHT